MKQEMMRIVSQKQLAPLIYELVLTGELVKEMKTPGQFLHIKIPREDLLLRRPISLAAIYPERQECVIIYRVEGEGTAVLSRLQAGGKIDVLGPLGNGFDLSFIQSGDPVFIIGGGIGTPPLYELGRQLKVKGAAITMIFGYASQAVQYYQQEFQELGELLVATDDGSTGFSGHVGMLLDHFLSETTIQPAAIYACGATGMLQTVEQRFKSHPHAYLSLEGRMACGMGACYACVCQMQTDSKKIESRKICDEGPVFRTGEVIL